MAPILCSWLGFNGLFLFFAWVFHSKALAGVLAATVVAVFLLAMGVA